MRTIPNPSGRSKARKLAVPDVTGMSQKEAAHAYLDAGLMPHPWRVSKGTKVSCYSGFQFDTIQETHESIDRWRRNWQCGLVVSKSSGLLAYDVDNRDDFEAWDAGDYPDTVWAHTGRNGGIHLLFDARGLAPEGWPTQGNVPGGQIKSNGFIAVEPSVHPNGRPYRWGALRSVAPVGSFAREITGWQAEQAGAGVSGSSLNGSGGSRADQHRRKAMEAGEAAPGAQHDSLRDYAYSLAKSWLSEGEGMTLLRAKADGLELDGRPWKDADLLRLWRSARAKVIPEPHPDSDEMDGEFRPIRSGRNDERYPILLASDLAEPAKPMNWLVRAFWPLGSHGPVGGPKKVLKSYNADAIALAVASGLPLLGNPEWPVPNALPVKILAGEGGVGPRRRRLQRIARDLYDIDDIRELPLAVLPAIAQFGSPALRRYIERAVEAIGGGGLTIIDSVYNYHPTGSEVQVSNVYDRGPMLARVEKMLREVAGDDETGLYVDHFRKTGNGALDLDSISQAGMGEFADSWALINHRENPDPDAGNFWLRLELGSRQDWPGAGWEIDWHIGEYDPDAGIWLDGISVEVARCGRFANSKGPGDRSRLSDDQIRSAIVAYVEGHEWGKTKDQVVTAAGGTKRARAAFDDLTEEGAIVTEERKRPEGLRKRMVKREVVGLGEVKARIGGEAK